MVKRRNVDPSTHDEACLIRLYLMQTLALSLQTRTPQPHMHTATAHGAKLPELQFHLLKHTDALTSQSWPNSRLFTKEDSSFYTPLSL